MAALRKACTEAVAHRDAGRAEEAVKKYEAALRIDGDCVAALVGLGLVHISLNKHDKAVHLF